MLNFHQLRIFYHVAKQLNYTRAAAELFVSQPAVTAQMKAFESYCGLTLLKKRGKKSWLTPAGETLFEYAKTVFGIEKEIENTIGELRELKRGVLRIGTTKAYARYFMPLMLSSFHKSHPNVQIELNEGSSHQITLGLLDFQNEIAIIAKTEPIAGVTFTPFSQEEMVLVAPPGHRLAGSRPVPFGLLAEEPFIMKDKGSGTRRLVDRLFAESGRTPNVLMEVGSAELIKQLVQRGDGVSLLVREAVAAELEEKKLAAIALEGEKVYLDVSIAHLADQSLSHPAQAFLQTLERLRAGRRMTREGIGAYMARILAEQLQKKA